ncbi:MAG: PQQ-dependent sugar dehydrogenase, partial [Pseudomonadota bacterium]
LSPLVLATALLSLSVTAPSLAQQNVEFRGNIPVAPTGIANQKLGPGPWTYATAEGMNIKVEVAARGIEYPMALTFLPDGDMLVVSRPGKIHRVRDGKLTEVAGGPPSVYFGISGEPSVAHGYIDIALHPDFATNSLIYLAYSKPAGDNNQRSLAIGRGRWNGTALEDFKDVWGGNDPTVSGAARIAFGLDKTLYIATAGRDPQDLNTAGGKTLHINDDGSIPANNPFAKTPNARPDVYSYGHRSTLGLTVHPVTGALWQNENGPNGGDEINMIEPGKNYGWPLVSLGRDYSGPWQSNGPNHTGYQGPIVYWMPAIAVSGMTFYTSDVMPKWKGSLFVGSLRTGEIPGTGHLERIVLNEKYEEFRRETLLVDLHQRMRDVKQGPDGFVYVATEEKDGVVLRISPLE